MAQKILSIGYDIPGFGDLVHPYSSEQSLLDADLIVFEPQIYGYGQDENYHGKTCFSSSGSFELTEATEHWKTELSTSLENGKTVFVFFTKFEEFFVHTGEKTYSGTGRNSRATNIVTGSDNYRFFPIRLPSITAKAGSEMHFTGHASLAAFWAEFKEYLKYESYLEGKIDTPLFVTKTGNKVVGGLFRVGKGHLVLLPPLRYPEEEFTSTNKKGEAVWNKKALQFGERLIQILVDIDKSLRGMDESTPPPEWTTEESFALPQAEQVRNSIAQVTKEIDALTTKKLELLGELKHEEQLTALLFEKGKPLEYAIIFALRLLGYSADNYDDGSLELDQVIMSPEKERFIGEAEGKDSSAINIDKFRQLESNIQEDLERTEVNTPAIGILFGNAFRLSIPSSRGEFFTEKCLTNAARLHAILIRTPDLFHVARYLRTNNDNSFAKRCREAITQARGKIVAFPEIPSK
jgi:hypothetical protein